MAIQEMSGTRIATVGVVAFIVDVTAGDYLVGAQITSLGAAQTTVTAILLFLGGDGALLTPKRPAFATRQGAIVAGLLDALVLVPLGVIHRPAVVGETVIPAGLAGMVRVTDIPMAGIAIPLRAVVLTESIVGVVSSLRSAVLTEAIVGVVSSLRTGMVILLVAVAGTGSGTVILLVALAGIALMVGFSRLGAGIPKADGGNGSNRNEQGLHDLLLGLGARMLGQCWHPRLRM